MATKPWRRNAWSFRADVMCNASTMAFHPALYPAAVSPPRRRAPHIFQRLEDAKEEHALRCHQDARQNYLQLKDKVKRQCGKSDQELLMENCHLYRTRLENAELLERARGIEDCHSGEQVVVGTKLPAADFITRAVEETEPCNSGSVMTQGVNLEAAGCDWDESKYGPRAELSTTTLFLHGKQGERVSSLVTLHNTGSTSLHYQWHRQPPISLLIQENHTSKCMVLAENEECISGDDHPRRASCFYIVPTAGCLVPGESKDFYIEFHPRFSGSFMETWILCFTPKLSTSLQALHLHGAAAVPEDVNSILQRKLLQQSLEIRQRTRGLEEISSEIIEKAIKQVQITFKKASDFVISNESFHFMRSNIECFEQTPLYYNPPVLLQFRDLAVEIHTKTQTNIEVVDSSISEASSSSITFTAYTWDLSVSNLILSLDNIDANENWKEMMRNRASCLQLLAAIPPHPIAILYTAMYKILVTIVTDIEEVMEEIGSQSISEASSTIELESISNFEAGFMNGLGSCTSKQASAYANVRQNSVKLSGSSRPKQAFANANVGQVDSVRTFGSGSPGDANVGRRNAPKQVTASGKDGRVAKNPDNGNPEQAHVGEMEENVLTCEERVRKLLQEGVVEQFSNNVEGAFAKLVPVVQKKIECYRAEGDEDSASWLSLWFTRLSHALAHQ